jgi:hypothetical protein
LQHPDEFLDRVRGMPDCADGHGRLLSLASK